MGKKKREHVVFDQMLKQKKSILFSKTIENRVKYTKEHIDVLENTILNCSSATTEDADINKVLVEEMPAYFSGQKTLDQVIRIAQDRVQKVLDERG